MAESLRRPDPAPVSPAAGGEREHLLERLGRLDPLTAASQTEIPHVRSDLFAQFPAPTWTRHELLAFLHRALRPRTYLEIGVDTGRSLALSRTRTIAVDPAYAITEPIACDLRAYPETSDAFFARDDALEHFGGLPVDLAFIDGMHLSEFVVRDLANVERFCGPGSVVVLDDVLPRNTLEACRVRRTRAWAGDVFRVRDVLAERRPDLALFLLNTSPTGTMLVAHLDATSRVLLDALEEIERGLVLPDPPEVPQEILGRTVADDPVWLRECGIWDAWVVARDAGAPAERFRELLAQARPARED